MRFDFMFGLLLENKSAVEAAAKISSLKKKLAELCSPFLILRCSRRVFLLRLFFLKLNACRFPG